MKQQHVEPQTSPDIQKVLTQLNSRKETDRQQAEQTIEALGQDAIDEFLAILNREAQTRRRRNRWIYGCVFGFMGFMLLLALITKDWDMLSSMGSMCGLLGVAAAATQTQKTLTKQLARFEDIRLVGAMTEGLEYDDKEVITLAEAWLTQHLPTLKASDSHLLNLEQRKILHRAVVKKKRPELAISILKALEQIGDTAAIPFVQKLAQGAGEERVRQAAIECLPYLERLEAERLSRETLLRASSAANVGAPAETLLRPASGTMEADPAQLLRASDQA